MRRAIAPETCRTPRRSPSGVSSSSRFDSFTRAEPSPIVNELESDLEQLHVEQKSWAQTSTAPESPGVTSTEADTVTIRNTEAETHEQPSERGQCQNNRDEQELDETPPPDPDTFALAVPGFLEAYAISAQDAPEIEKIATTAQLMAGRRTSGESYHALASKLNALDPGLQVTADELVKFEDFLAGYGSGILPLLS